MEAAELRQWRQDRGYTRLVLSLMLGVDQSTVARWESGQRKIPPLLVLALRAIGGERT